MKTERRALVTGGGGFIGSHLVRRLLGEGYGVRVLDNFATGRRENLASVEDAVDLVEGDVQSYERVHNATRGVDLVFHQAALPSVPRSIQDPLTTNATNVTGTLNVLLAARDENVERVVFASSSSLYGANPNLPKREDMACAPIAPYAVSKLAAEGYCRSFFSVYGLETVALRYFNIFGPGQDPMSQYAAVIPRFVTLALAGKRPVVHGDGEQSRDFTYIDNAIDANLLAATTGDIGGEVMNVACGARISLNSVIKSISKLIDQEIDPIYTDPRPGDVQHSLADISRAEALMGYVPKISLEAGLERAIPSYS